MRMFAALLALNGEYGCPSLARNLERQAARLRIAPPAFYARLVELDTLPLPAATRRLFELM